MATSFYGGSFFGGEFFNVGGAAAPTPISGGGRYRYFSPLPPPLYGRLKRRVDDVIEKEARLKEAIAKYGDSGADAVVLDDLLRQLRELQLMILRMALESALVSQYIEWKRKQEDEDIAFILTLL